MLTLDEAIAHAEHQGTVGGMCGMEHRQLAEWLKELKMYREMQTDHLALAKAAINATVGEHPVHETQAWALLSIANSLVALCERSKL